MQQLMSKDVREGKNPGDQYAVLQFMGATTQQITLPNGEVIELAVKPMKTTVTAWIDRSGTNAKMVEEGKEPFNIEGEYDFLNQLQEGGWVRATTLTVEHEPRMVNIGTQLIEIRASKVLVNAYPIDSDFNVAVQRACKAQGIVALNTAYRSVNKVVGTNAVTQQEPTDSNA